MKLGIGIDTGGTYTDAVIFDYETRRVLDKSKALTTHEELSEGIGRALDGLDPALTARAETIVLSTTLATNACVEEKGGRARLILMGTDEKVMAWIDAKTRYGLRPEDVLCVDARTGFDGSVEEMPDWEKVMAGHDAWLRDAQALAVTELNAPRNGAVCEREARKALSARYDVPLVLAGELTNELNIMERGATALLNARLLPVIDEFLQAVRRALDARGIRAERMIVRSDGSLMSEVHARTAPVQTILSGPAASVVGSRVLAGSENCLIVDMGGTTTDVSIVRGGQPRRTDGIRIGGYRTQIGGVYIDTFGLGGDSRVVVRDGELNLTARRVQPLCVALARHPELKDALRAVSKNTKAATLPLHEGLMLMRRPADPERYSETERRLIAALEDGPMLLGERRVDVYNLGSDRLEAEGAVLRFGMTPTDAMHIRGDFDRFDAEASRMGAEFLYRRIPGMESPEAFADAIYDRVCEKMYEGVVRILLSDAHPRWFKAGMDEQLKRMIHESWISDGDGFFNYRFHTRAKLVGIGAPTHLFLPRVAEKLGAECILPEHAEVANAVGAAAAGFSARAKVPVQPLRGDMGSTDGYAVYAADETRTFEEMEDALAFARQAAAAQAEREARRHGADGPLNIVVRDDARTASSRYGTPVDLGVTVIADASSERF